MSYNNNTQNKSRIQALILTFVMIISSLFAGAEGTSAYALKKTKTPVTNIKSVKLSDLGDGVYEGQGEGFDASSSGNVFVSTSIKDKKIKEIKVLRHRVFHDNQSVQEQNFNSTKELIINEIIRTQKTDFSESEIKELLKDLIKDMNPIQKNQCIKDAGGIADATAHSFTTEANNSKQIYLDPIDGSDAKNGDSSLNAVKTFARGKSLLPAGGKIILMQNWKIGRDENVILDSKSSAPIEIRRQAGFLKDMIKVNGTLTVKNCTLDGHGIIQSRGSVISVSSFENSKGLFTLENGAVIRNNRSSGSGAGVYVSNDGEMKMKGGSIENNTTYNRGGGICIDSCKVNMTGGRIYKNTALKSTGNDTGSGGGVVNIGSSGKGLTMDGGEISHNHAEKRGGGIAGSYQIFKMTDGSISENTSDNGSGGISDVGHYWETTLILKGGNITENTGKAPGIDLKEENSLMLSGNITIKDNLNEDNKSNLNTKHAKIIGSLTGEVHFAGDDAVIEGGTEHSGGQIYKLTEGDSASIYNDEGLTPVLQENSNKIYFISASDPGIKISRTYVNMAVNDEVQLSAQSIPEIPGEVMKWTVDDPKIIALTQDGKIKALKKGRTTVRVTNTAGKTATCRVIVVPEKLPDNLKDGIYTGTSKYGNPSGLMKIQLYVSNGKIRDIKIVKHNENLIEKGFADTYIDGILEYYTLDRPFIKGHETVCLKVQEAIENALKSEPYEVKPLKTVYLDPMYGDDSNFGNSEKEAVKTYEKALSLTVEKSNATIFLMNPISVDKKEVFDSKVTVRKITLKRHKKFKGAMFKLHGGDLVLRNMIIDGNKQEAGKTSPVVLIPGSNNKRDFALRLKENITIQNNKASDGSVISCNHNLCSVYMTGGKITNNEASSGALIKINKGDFKMASGNISKNQTKVGVIDGKSGFETIKFEGSPRIESNYAMNRAKLNLKRVRMGICGKLKSGAIISVDNQKVLFKGCKKDVYDKGSYTINKGDLKYLKHSQKLMVRISKNHVAYFSVLKPVLKGKAYRRKVKFRWKNVPNAKYYKVYKNKKFYKKIFVKKGKLNKLIFKLKRKRAIRLKVYAVGTNGYHSLLATKKLRAK